MALRRAAILALAAALAGCGGAVEGWRSVAGLNVNDPDPVTAPFANNLAQAETAPYPNLADVPPPPTRATTAAERQRLAQSLAADRAATQALAAAPLAAQPGAALPARGAAPPQKIAAYEVTPGVRRGSAPPEPPPQDSTLVMPQVRSLPEPETARPPPPAPALAAAPRLTTLAAPLAAPAAAPPEPAPPVPVIAPVAPPPVIRSEPRRPTLVATLAAAEPAGDERAAIARVAALYRETPGALRVVGYAAAPSAGGDPFGSYRAMLERTQAIARALADAGIPAARIQSEAAPAAAGRTAGRIEIQLTP
jgi:hypothetical protein